jgi:DNA repair protein SbcD/Mre11
MTTLLAIGDMHLGRPPTALPEDLRHRSPELGPQAAWELAVDEAIDRAVDGVLLAGDLVERSRDFFVAYGQLKAGIEKLAEAGIPVLAVAGNHDTHVLPRLADEIEHLHLLGRAGKWETAHLDDVSILGWSFPQPRVRRSPLESLESLDRNQGDGVVIGLLHCDRDQPDSAHAPVSSEALKSAPVDAWLLGHIHRPDALDEDRPIGYLGSINALRASETGARGPWMVQVTAGTVTADQVPLAPLRYERLEIDCSDIADAERLGEQVLAACRALVKAFDQGKWRPRALGLRVVLTGHTAAASALAAVASDLSDDGRSWDEGGIACFIHKIELAVSPAIELKRLARQSDPCGLLARRLLALDEPGSDEYRRLVEMGREQMAPTTQAREFRDLEPPLDERAVVRWLRQAGLVALTRLLEQRGAQR